MFAILSALFRYISLCSSFRIMTAVFLGVRIFRKFTISVVAPPHCSMEQFYRIFNNSTSFQMACWAVFHFLHSFFPF